jgi:1,4-dihydroxy-2-naphthoate octaprenyltransferase
MSIQTQGISKWQAWILAARPRTLPASISGIIVGTALAIADQTFALLPALAALAGALLLQIGSNIANDYFDHMRGIDTPDRRGPVRVTHSGLIPVDEVRMGMIVVLALATAVGVYLAVVGGWLIVAIGLAAIVSAVIYSGGPFPLASHGLGDVFVFLFFGLAAVVGTYYVQALSLGAKVLAAAIPVGTLVTAIIVVNNLRDIDTDRRASKRTLAVILGPGATWLEYVTLVAVAYVIPIVFWLAGWSSVWVMASWLSLPLAAKLIRAVRRAADGPAFNTALAGTARLALVFSVLFAIGLVP